MSPAKVEIKVQDEKNLLVTTEKVQIMPGIRSWVNHNNGFRIIDLEYTADPAKRDPEWLRVQKKGLPVAEFNREYGEKWVIYEGKPVYEDYDPDIHDLRGAIYALRRCKLISGWDGGPADTNLAWALALAFPDEMALLFIDELWINDGDVPGFVEVVRGRLSMDWFKISGGHSIHVADPSVFTANNITKSSMADEMRRQGMAPVPGAVSWSARRTAVTDLLKMNYRSKGEGKVVPKFRIHERCEMTREGLGGGYHYPKAAAGVGGQFKPLPVKNEFSHLLNAVEYACSKIGAVNQYIPFEGKPLPKHGVI